MSKQEKLLDKLRRGAIDARELRTLLKQRGWHHDHNKGSHEIWAKDSATFVLATHSNDLKAYQTKQARQILLEDQDEENKES